MVSDDSSVVSSGDSSEHSRSSENESDDCKVVAGNEDGETAFLKVSIRKCLDEVETTGSFACFNTVYAPLPGLHVKKLGDIGLPLTTRDAKAIIKVSHQSAFGKGAKTIVDTSVRKCWELNPTDFELQNPAWKAQVQKILDRVVNDLGVSCDASAHLYKLLLYEEGAFFLPHQDSEKEDRMFGTLVVSLPSKHIGGNVHLSHAGKTKVFDSSKTSRFEFSFAAWFSDVTHEVKPVEGGYRLVLTYNLIRPTEGPAQSAAILGNKTQRLRDILARWKENYDREGDCPSVVAYKLDHQYTDANLRFDHLKGGDQLKARYFRDSCAKEGFTMYLANIVKEVTGGVEDDYSGYYVSGVQEIQDITDESLKLSNVIGLDGTVVAKSMDLTEDDIDFVQGDIFDREPDDEDFEGYTGNEGSYATHWYRDTLVIVLPDSYQTSFLFTGVRMNEASLESWIDRLLNSVRTSASSKKDAEKLKEVCSLAFKMNQGKWVKDNFSRDRRSKTYSDALFTKVASIALELGWKEGFGLAVAEIDTVTSTTIFGDIGKAIANTGFSGLHNGTNMALSKTGHLHQKYGALQQLESHYGTRARERGKTSHLKNFQEWKSDKMNELIDSAPSLVKADAASLADMFERYASSTSTETLADQIPEERRRKPANQGSKIMALVQKNASNTAFAISFITHLYASGEKGLVPKDTVVETYAKVLHDILPSFDIGSAISANKRQKTDHTFYNARYQPGIRHQDASTGSLDAATTIYAEDLVRLIQQCESLSLSHSITRIITGLNKQATAQPSEHLFHSILFPFLTLLLSHLSSSNHTSSSSSSPYPSLFLTTLWSYLYNQVGPEPKAPTNWSLPIISSCQGACEDCTALNDFLRHPTQQVAEYKVIQHRRKHLEEKIRSVDVKSDTIRKRSPYTLKLTKTRWGYQRSLREWKANRQDAEKRIVELEKIAPELFKELLGNKYDIVRNLKVDVLEAGGVARDEEKSEGTGPSALQPLSQNRKRPASALEEKTEGASRGAEIIDLT